MLQEELLLSSFVRLVDYICSEALIVHVIHNTSHLLAQLRAPRAVDSEKLPRPTFVALVDFEAVGMSFAPSEAAVHDMLRHNVIEGAPVAAVPFARPEAAVHDMRVHLWRNGRLVASEPACVSAAGSQFTAPNLRSKQFLEM